MHWVPACSHNASGSPVRINVWLHGRESPAHARAGDIHTHVIRLAGKIVIQAQVRISESLHKRAMHVSCPSCNAHAHRVNMLDHECENNHEQHGLACAFTCMQTCVRVCMHAACERASVRRACVCAGAHAHVRGCERRIHDGCHRLTPVYVPNNPTHHHFHTMVSDPQLTCVFRASDTLERSCLFLVYVSV
jgi:hypothetical protein